MPPTDEPPLLHHSLQQKGSSVLCLAADSYHIYSGSQGYDINVSHRGMSGRVPTSVLSVQVWDKATFKLKTTLRGHTASVLALEYAPEEKWLFSASGMCTTRIY